MTRVHAIHGTIVSIPVRHRIVSSVRDTDRVINVLVEVETTEGVSGLAYVAGFTRHKAAAILAMLEDLAEVVVGCDATATGLIWDRMWAACRLAGFGGLATFALSAIDTALWDIQGKLLGAPLHRLLGTRRREVPAYASDGCWLHDDPAHVAAEAAAFAGDGFGAVKIRFGRRDPATDLVTLEAVRREVGEQIKVMVDVNQGWSRAQAHRYGPRLAEFDVEWLEEPLAAGDIEGLAELRRELPVPITAGENVYLPEGVADLLNARAVSVVMPDLQRVGGITGWIRANALAETASIPITSHLFPEVSIHLLAASRIAGPLEWVTWLVPVLAEPLTITNGTVTVPDRPGLGIAFDPAAVQQYRL